MLDYALASGDYASKVDADPHSDSAIWSLLLIRCHIPGFIIDSGANIAYHPPAATFPACFTVVSLCGLRG